MWRRGVYELVDSVVRKDISKGGGAVSGSRVRSRDDTK